MKNFFVLLLLNYNLLACTFNYVSPKDQYKSADIIFIGMLTEKPFFTNSGFITKLSVSESTKGNMDETVIIHSGTGAGESGFRFADSEDYLVYAHKTEDYYLTNTCPRRSLISEAFTGLEFIKRRPDSSSFFDGWYSSGEIFIGKALNFFKNKDREYFTFEVLKSFKGKLPDTLQLSGSLHKIEEGKEYLIKTNFIGFTYFIEDIIPYELASESINYLNTKPAAGDNDFSIFSGIAYLKKNISEEIRSMGRFSFYLEEEGKKYRIITGVDGAFFTDSIPPGRYKITVDEYQAIGVMIGEEDSLTLPYRDILDKNLYFAPFNSISGAAADYDGKPAISALIEIISEELTGTYKKRFTTVTDELGRFIFSNIPLGRYILGINITTRTSPKNPFSQTFYNSKDSSPEVIEIEKEVSLTGINLKVKEIFEVRTLTGKLVDTSGFPAEGKVCFKDSTAEGTLLVCSTAEKESGSFTMEVIGEGWLHITSKFNKTKIAVPVKIEKNRIYKNILITVDEFQFDPPGTWFIGKVTDEEFFLPDLSDFGKYDSLRMLFKEWCCDENQPIDIYSDLSTYYNTKELADEHLCPSGILFYPDGRLIYNFPRHKQEPLPVEFRWRLNNDNKKLLAIVAPNDDIMHTLDIIYLDKEKLILRLNGILGFYIGNDSIHLEVTQKRNSRSRISTKFVIPLKGAE